MSFTLRDRRVWFRAAMAWALLTLLAAVAGPFGTFAELTLAGRLGYWALVAAVSLGLTLAQLALTRGWPESARLLTQVPYAFAIAGFVHLLNRLVFPGWSGTGRFLFLLSVVAVLVLVVEAALWLLRPAPAPAQAAADTGGTAAVRKFQMRLPVQKRGELVRLEAQDHYLLAVTDKGSEMILMRLSDAEAELQEAPGLRVHRSHWVAVPQVREHRRRNGRDFLVMSDGGEVPVSRSCRPAAQAAGLI